jgi:hypothetical protein
VATLLSFFVTTSCSVPFEPGSTVSEVRLLAVQGAPSYASPGETIALRALTADPQKRTLSVGWTTCENPDSSVVNACLDQIVANRAVGRAPSWTVGNDLTDFSLTIPSDAITSLPAAAISNATIGVVTVVCPGTIVLPAEGSVADALPFRCLDSEGQSLPPERFVVSVKRIAVRSHDHNANPSIELVEWNGVPWPEGESREAAPCNNEPVQYADCNGGGSPTISVHASDGAAETGTDEFGTPFREQLIVQNYATAGVFEYDVRRADAPGAKWAARHSASGSDQTMWFVLHDDRGGVSWTSRTVHVR